MLKTCTSPRKQRLRTIGDSSETCRHIASTICSSKEGSTLLHVNKAVFKGGGSHRQGEEMVLVYKKPPDYEYLEIH